MIRYCLLMLLLTIAGNAHAGWARDRVGCEVYVPTTLEQAEFYWRGPCVNGKANGPGRLLNLGFRFEGEFQDGRPIAGSGRYIAIDANGAREPRQLTLTRGEYVDQPLSAVPGGQPAPLGPLVGKWKVEYRNPSCTAFVEYRKSNEAKDYGPHYETSTVVQLFDLPDHAGWQGLSSVVVSFVSGADCRGEKAEGSKVSVVYLKREAGRLNYCSAPSLPTCFATGSLLAPDVWATEREKLPVTRSLITSRSINRSEGSLVAPNLRGANAPDREEIEITFDRNKGALYALYGRALRDNPKLQGKIVLRFTIMESGRVGNCTVVSSELGDAELERKICTRVGLMQFKPRSQPITVDKPIDFFPAA